MLIYYPWPHLRFTEAEILDLELEELQVTIAICFSNEPYFGTSVLDTTQEPFSYSRCYDTRF